jgi:hypothetical protein
MRKRKRTAESKPTLPLIPILLLLMGQKALIAIPCMVYLLKKVIYGFIFVPQGYGVVHVSLK